MRSHPGLARAQGREAPRISVLGTSVACAGGGSEHFLGAEYLLDAVFPGPAVNLGGCKGLVLRMNCMSIFISSFNTPLV